MAILVEYPFLAAIPAAVFLALFVFSRKRVALVAAAAWVLYLLHEYAMRLPIFCPGECDIRIDLLAIYPALLVLSVVALVVSARALGRRGD